MAGLPTARVRGTGWTSRAGYATPLISAPSTAPAGRPGARRELGAGRAAAGLARQVGRADVPAAMRAHRAMPRAGVLAAHGAVLRPRERVRLAVHMTLLAVGRAPVRDPPQGVS